MKQYCLNIDNIFTKSIGEKLILFLQQQQKTTTQSNNKKRRRKKTTTKKTTKKIIYIRQIDYAHEKNALWLYFLNKDHTS